jgi:hypothetical protein
MARNNAAYPFALYFRQNNQPFDVTGRSLQMSFKNAAGQAAGATLRTSDGSIALQNPATWALCIIPYAAMQGMKQGTWFWDLLDVTNAQAPLPFGAGTKPTLLLSCTNMDSITVTAPGADAITIHAAPSGPPGSGASFAPQMAPAPPASGFLIFCDTADGQLKVIDSSGNIARIPLT